MQVEREDPLFGILTKFHTTLKVLSIAAFQLDSVPHTVTCGFQFGGILWPVIFQNIFRKQHKVVVKLIFCQVRALLTLTFSITTTSLNEHYFNRHTHTYPHTCICTHVTSSMEPGTLLGFAFIHGCVQCTWSSQPTTTVF